MALAPGVRWRPFVLDTWGHLGPGTVRFLEELAEERGGRRRRRGAWATVEGAYGGDDAEDPTISWLAGWRQRISVVVARQAAAPLHSSQVDRAATSREPRVGGSKDDIFRGANRG